MASERYLKAKIRRLESEISEIENYFYDASQKDLGLHAAMLERKRDDAVRAAALQMHTAIEDLLNSLIVHKVLRAESSSRKRKLRSASGQAVHKMLYGGGSVGFEMKLNLAVAHRVIGAKVKDKLVILNTLRNRCSHNWLLKAPVRRGRRPAQKKPPLLQYGGDDLHKPAILKNFCYEYGKVYVDLFMKL